VLAFAQLLFSALAIVNVRLQKVPSDNLAVSIPKWAPAKIKPSIHTIESPGS